MTNNEPRSGHLSNDVNADDTSGSPDGAAHRATNDATPLNADTATSGAPLGTHTASDSSESDDSAVAASDADAGRDSGPGSDAGPNNDKTGGNLGDLGDPAHPFDQTNGIVEGLEGDSDEADGDEPTPA